MFPTLSKPARQEVLASREQADVHLYLHNRRQAFRPIPQKINSAPRSYVKARAADYGCLNSITIASPSPRSSSF